MAPTASAEEIRAAYRALARRHHPDAHGGNSARMAVVNEAFRVLSDPGRRAMYDAGLRGRSVAASPAGSAGTAGPAGPGTTARPANPAAPVRHGRFAIPLPWVLVLGVLAAIFLVTAYAGRPGGDGGTDSTPVDGVVRPGECVDVNDAGRAAETSCDGSFDGVAEAIVPLDGRCPRRTEGFPDTAGQGIVCLRRP